MQFLVDDFVGLVEVLAALGVSDERVCCADGLEHGCGGLAGVGAFFSEMHVLQAYGDVGGGCGFDDGRERSDGWKDGDFVAGVAGYERQECVHEGFGFSGGFVHLPVGGDECFTRHVV